MKLHVNRGRCNCGPRPKRNERRTRTRRPKNALEIVAGAVAVEAEAFGHLEKSTKDKEAYDR